MTLAVFLNTLGAAMGFMAALFFVAGAMRMRPVDIQGIAQGRWDFHEPLANALSEQKAQYLAGAASPVASFSLRIAANFAPPSAAIARPRFAGADGKVRS